jgi:hypothetical protein
MLTAVTATSPATANQATHLKRSNRQQACAFVAEYLNAIVTAKDVDTFVKIVTKSRLDIFGPTVERPLERAIDKWKRDFSNTHFAMGCCSQGRCLWELRPERARYQATLHEGPLYRSLGIRAVITKNGIQVEEIPAQGLLDYLSNKPCPPSTFRPFTAQDVHLFSGLRGPATFIKRCFDQMRFSFFIRDNLKKSPLQLGS